MTAGSQRTTEGFWQQAGFVPDRGESGGHGGDREVRILTEEGFREQFFDGGKSEWFGQTGVAGGIQKGPNLLGLRVAGEEDDPAG